LRLEHDPEKWQPVFGRDHAPPQKHDPKNDNRFSEKIMLHRKSMIPKSGNRFSEKIMLHRKI
jgi:hypothetical protein